MKALVLVYFIYVLFFSYLYFEAMTCKVNGIELDKCTHKVVKEQINTPKEINNDRKY